MASDPDGQPRLLPKTPQGGGQGSDYNIIKQEQSEPSRGGGGWGGVGVVRLGQRARGVVARAVSRKCEIA